MDQADSGTIITMNGMRIGYLSQNPLFVDGTTVLQQVFRGENPQLALVRDYEETMNALAKTPENEGLLKKAADLAEKMDKAEAWSLESEAKTILTKLGISDFEQKVETLSGGQKKRVALAAALIAPLLAKAAKVKDTPSQPEVPDTPETPDTPEETEIILPPVIPLNRG